VATGRSQFGLYYSPDTLMALEEGAGLLSIGSLMAHAPVGMAFKPGLVVETPAELEGRRASLPLIPSTRASFASMLEAAGIAPESVQVVDPGFELVAPLLTGVVDAAAFTEFGELVAAKAEGAELVYLDFRDWGTPDYAFLNVITTSDFAASEAETVRAFLRATYEGLAFAASHPEEAVEIYVKAHPELEAGLLLAQWKAAIPSLALADEGRRAGWQDLDAWIALSTWMQEVELIAGPIDPALSVTNDYLPEAE
jgi:ABC-type nitrate/sulfonate/bicarbonate transport system substrate-binding protein